MDTGTALLNGIAYIPLLGFSGLAFKYQYPVLFAVLSGVAMVSGLYTPDLLGAHDLSVAIGLGLVAYALFCVGMTYKNMFTGDMT